MNPRDCPNFRDIRSKLPNKNGELDKLRSEILQLIKRHTDIDIRDANENIVVNKYDKTTERSLCHFPQKGKVHVLTTQQISQCFKKNPYKVMGFYNAEYGKQFLNNYSWCLSTFIHECLHSVSNFSLRFSSLPSTEFPCEGITELLTGYILCRCKEDINQLVNNECCSGWKPNKGCYLRRLRNDVMMFYFITSKINIDALFKIYLDHEIENPINKLVEELQKINSNFRDDRINWSKPIIGRRYLHEELTKCFGVEYYTYMNSGQPKITFPITI